MSLASPDVRAAAIEAGEFPRLTAEMNVRAVPTVAVNGVPLWEGNVPERVFLDRLLASTID